MTSDNGDKLDVGSRRYLASGSEEGNPLFNEVKRACRNRKRLLNEENISYHEIDIDQNEVAARQVFEWSSGRRVIHTYVI